MWPVCLFGSWALATLWCAMVIAYDGDWAPVYFIRCGRREESYVVDDSAPTNADVDEMGEGGATASENYNRRRRRPLSISNAIHTLSHAETVVSSFSITNKGGHCFFFHSRVIVLICVPFWIRLFHEIRIMATVPWVLGGRWYWRCGLWWRWLLFYYKCVY